MKAKRKSRSGPSGQHETHRASIRVPDPDRRAPLWRAMAEADGLTLGQLVATLLEAEMKRRG